MAIRSMIFFLILVGLNPPAHAEELTCNENSSIHTSLNLSEDSFIKPDIHPEAPMRERKRCYSDFVLNGFTLTIDGSQLDGRSIYLFGRAKGEGEVIVDANVIFGPKHQHQDENTKHVIRIRNSSYIIISSLHTAITSDLLIEDHPKTLVIWSAPFQIASHVNVEIHRKEGYLDSSHQTFRSLKVKSDFKIRIGSSTGRRLTVDRMFHDDVEIPKGVYSIAELPKVFHHHTRPNNTLVVMGDNKDPEEPLAFHHEVGEIEWSEEKEPAYSFQSEFENPVVILSPALQNDPVGLLSIDKVEQDHFSVRHDHWSYNKGSKPNPAKMKYFVSKKGVQHLHGLPFEASHAYVKYEIGGRYNVKKPKWSTVLFDKMFVKAPYVLTSIQQVDSECVRPANVRVKYITGSSMAITAQPEERTKSGCVEAILHWVAFDPEIRTSLYQVEKGTLDHHYESIINGTLPFVQVNSFHGPDPFQLEYSIQNDQPSLRILEDRSLDDEIEHAEEGIIYLNFP